MRDRARTVYSARKQAPSERVLLETRAAVAERRPDVLLLSAYLGHQPSVSALCRLAAEAGIPVLLGGPAFNNPDTAAAWASIPGLTAIVGAEADFTLPAIVATTLAGGDLTRHEGVFLPDGRQGPPAPPLADLSRLPVPDFADFPWHLYRTAVVPVMTGRGCSWGRCLFCSDGRDGEREGTLVRKRRDIPRRGVPVPAGSCSIGRQRRQSRSATSRTYIAPDGEQDAMWELWGMRRNPGFQRHSPGGRTTWVGRSTWGAMVDKVLDQGNGYWKDCRRVGYELPGGHIRLSECVGAA